MIAQAKVEQIMELLADRGAQSAREITERLDWAKDHPNGRALVDRTLAILCGQKRADRFEAEGDAGQAQWLYHSLEANYEDGGEQPEGMPK